MPSLSVGKVFVFRTSTRYGGTPYGLAEVVGTKSRVHGGEEVELFRVHFLNQKREALVRGWRKEFRELATRTEANAILKLVAEPVDTTDELRRMTWNRRYRWLQEQIYGGERLTDLAEAYRVLKAFSREKRLTFGEQKHYECARHALVEELAYVTERGDSEIEKKL